MGLLDSVGSALKGALGQIEAEAVPALLSAALAKTNLGDLQGLANKLQQGGLKDQVQSWLGTGANQPVTSDQILAALGNEHVKQIADHFGVPIDGALKLLAENLPGIIDQASPSGKLQPAA
ncbi:MAG TPA: YidB family protein [Candidatus Cybelea sp.]|nr:YidB family protein [Candidatus Cybelea sp.]